MITMEWQTKIQTLYNKFLFSLGLCDLCGNYLSDKIMPNQTLLCSSCFADLPLFKQELIQGDLLNWPSINKALPNSHFDHLVCLSPYLPPFTQWLPQFKYQGRFELASLFAKLLAQRWENENLIKLASTVDLILSVPLHISKWQIRGYNQAHLLAANFAKKANISYLPNAIKRTHKNISQAGQTGAARRKNLRHAFKLSTEHLTDKKIQLPEHVILLDDVVTTGSTCNEICRLLKNNGVKKVTVLSICLSLPDNAVNANCN